MRHTGVGFALAFLVFLGAENAAAQMRKIPCKTQEIAPSCYWAHGRLSIYNGSPSFRLWKVGTHRILGIYSGPSVGRWGLDNEGPELPSNVERVLNLNTRIFADFEVCPLEPEKPEHMQAVCIESARHIVVEKN